MLHNRRDWFPRQQEVPRPTTGRSHVSRILANGAGQLEAVVAEMGRQVQCGTGLNHLKMNSCAMKLYIVLVDGQYTCNNGSTVTSEHGIFYYMGA